MTGSIKMTGSDGKGVPMNGTWKWSDIVVTREIGRRNEVTK